MILIDGGLGQLHAALDAFEKLRAAVEADGVDARQPPMVVSLAKREELIYVQARSQPIKLARNNEALRLLQQVRDEAHRFGQHYHHLLRSKRAIEGEVKSGRRPPPAKKKRGKGKKGEIVVEMEEGQGDLA